MANSVLYVVSVNGRDAPISPNLMKKQTHPYLGWPEGELISAYVHVWVNHSFKTGSNLSLRSY